MILSINKATSSTLALLLVLSEALEGCPEVRFQILPQFDQSISLLDIDFTYFDILDPYADA